MTESSWPPILNQSGSDEEGEEAWGTPTWMMRDLAEEFLPFPSEGFDVDPCCDGPENAKGRVYLTPADDGLATEWIDPAYPDHPSAVFCNPPYTRKGMKLWMRKAIEEIEDRRAFVVVLLIPYRSGTLWFDGLITHRSCVEVRRIVGRIKYQHPTDPTKWNSATFDSAIVVLRQFNRGVTVGQPRFTRWDIRARQSAYVKAQKAQA